MGVENPKISSFPEQAQFCYPWRPYQESVLEEVDVHLDDNHLNVVAAPGSGKTVLGLEVMLRINKPTLILAPSIAIRNQWLSRFLDLFLAGIDCPDWISLNVKDPKFLTISTYQGLHAAFSDEKEFEDDLDTLEEEEKERSQVSEYEDKEEKVAQVVKNLKKVGLNTVVIDEAHHLRSAWWKSLTTLKEALEKPQIVALTATPPYDVDPKEWNNYKELCGPVDAEISVPELVAESNLCPHQDYVFVNSLAKRELIMIHAFRKEVKTFLTSLKRDNLFAEALLKHPVLLNPALHVEEILANPEFYSSVLIFLNAVGRDLPKELNEILAVRRNFVPRFKEEWAEILMEQILYRDQYFAENCQEIVKNYRSVLKSIAAIERKKVSLKNNKLTKKILRESIKKLDSIVEIVRFERANLGSGLRMVILTDFIRKDSLPKDGDEKKELMQIGVVPIFEKLRRDGLNHKLGVLSGGLVLLPKEAGERLKVIWSEAGDELDDLKLTPLSCDPAFVELRIKGADNHKKVQVITQLFTEGQIEVLVGTKSLLGEGWDAPSINSLVLASFVGSFMLSNQMRGRAIRIDKNNPEKVSNIWHLVSIELQEKNPGHDYGILHRRFKSFVGLAVSEDVIENGLERLEIGLAPFSQGDIRKLNEGSFSLAADRVELSQKWRRVLLSGEVKKIIPEVATVKEELPRNFVFGATIFALFWRSLMIGAIYGMQALEVVLASQDLKEVIAVVIVSLGVIFFVSLPGLLKSLWLFLRHGPVLSSIKSIGNAVLKTLCKMNAIKTDVNKLRISANKNKHTISLGLEGGTSYEKTLFLDAIEEVLDPIQNPRYMIVRKSLFGRLVRRDYHPVPSVIGAKKEWALYFSKMWNKYVGDNRLIYTRTLEGRKALLNGRQRSLASGLAKRSERVSRWK